MRTRIKICGLTREADVAAAVGAGADAIGLVLYAESPRHISLERAAALARGLDLLDCALRFPNAQALLLDAAVDGYGGGGKVFDWSLIPRDLPADVRSRLVLSGGLNPANVIDGILHARPYAVDVSSGVESERGIKDAALMRRFCGLVREADARVADLAT